jgi:hypothetical protein
MIGRVAPTAAAIDRLDMALIAMASPGLDPFDRRLLWARAADIPWKTIQNRERRNRVSLWRVYDRALAEFALTVIEAMKRRSAA